MSDLDPKEKKRLRALVQLESAARKKGFNLIAGVDEAGRGPLAGPVVAAACILPRNFFVPGIDDSKKLSPKERARILQILQSNHQVHCGVGIVSPDIIDKINIYQATICAMKIAIENLPQPPDYLLVDGMTLPDCPIPHSKEIQGDARSQSIAAASIVAKETRDKIMLDYHSQWPEYGFDRHKGYPTEYHVAAIEKYGPCAIHRMTFHPLKLLVTV